MVDKTGKNMRKKPAAEDIPSMLSPKSDLIFKLIFGDAKNIDILRSFLVAALDIPADDYEEIEIVDPHLKREMPGDKLGILDVLIQTKSKKRINVEIQVLETPSMPERVTFYASKLLSSQLSSGDEYDELKRVINIVILDYELIQDSSSYHNKYRLCDLKTGSTFTDVLEIHTMELGKLPEFPDDEGVELFYWLKFIGSEDKEEMEMATTKSPEIKKAYGVLKRLSADERTRMQYELREKARRDEAARLRGALRKGMEKGIAKEKTLIAQRMLARGMEADVVADLAGLSLDEVMSLGLKKVNPKPPHA